ncbi:MAG: hypothetical protein U1E87_00425 [Alphaproteobacteria bacterium]
MSELLWTSYGILAGTALGFAGIAIGLVVVRDRFARPSAQSRQERP